MQTMEGMETEVNGLKVDIIRLRAIIGSVSGTMIGTADAMKAVSLANDQVLKLVALFDKRLDVTDERLELFAQRMKLLEHWEERIKAVERQVKD